MTPAERKSRAMWRAWERQRQEEGRAWWAAAEGGDLVSVIRSPAHGFPCCVVTDVGPHHGHLIIHGHRVPDDYPGPDHVFRGRSCTATTVDAKHGTELTDGLTGRVFIVNAEDAKISNALARADAHRIVVRPAKPPPIQVPRRGAYRVE